MSKEPNAALRWALLCVLALIVIGWMPIMLRTDEWAFLPSITWATWSFWPSMALAAICAIVPTVVAVRTPILDAGNRKSIKYLIYLAITPAVFGTLGYYAVTAGGPMLYTWVAGKSTEVPYAIDRTGRSEDWKCRNWILLQDLPPLTSKLCGFPEEFIADLSARSDDPCVRERIAARHLRCICPACRPVSRWVRARTHHFDAPHTPP